LHAVGASQPAASERRRLLLVSHRPLAYGGVGATRWGFFLRAMPDLGWDVETVTARTNPTADEMSSHPRVAWLSALRARVMGTVGKAIRPAFRRTLGAQPEAFPPNTLWSFTGRRPIRRAIETFGPDVIVATAPPPSALFASVAAARGTSIPVVADMRDLWAGSPYYDAGGTLLTQIERRTFAASAAVVVMTDPSLSELRARHPELAERMQVLPNGFDPAILALRDTAPARRGGKMTLIHPGALYGERSVDVLVQALSRFGLRERVRLELVGNMNASSLAAVRAAPSELEIDAIPPLPWQETIRRMAEADAVVMIFPPQLGDVSAWPVKMFEGLALGKPILSLTGGGAGETLLQVLGAGQACAQWDDVDSVAAATQRLLDNPPAPLNPAKLARFDRSAVAGAYVALLERVVAEGPFPASSTQ